jgi:hypothetical protein
MKALHIFVNKLGIQGHYWTKRDLIKIPISDWMKLVFFFNSLFGSATYALCRAPVFKKQSV